MFVRLGSGVSAEVTEGEELEQQCRPYVEEALKKRHGADVTLGKT